MSVNMIKILMSLCEYATLNGRQKVFFIQKTATVSKVISQEAQNVITINNLCIEFKFKQINEVSFASAQGQEGRLLFREIYNFNFFNDPFWT